MNGIPTISYISSAIVLYYSYFQWDIIDVVTPFLIILISGPVYIFFLVGLISSTIYLFKKWSIIKQKALLPFLVSYTTLILLLVFPFTSSKIYIDFFTTKHKMENVVRMVETEELYPNVDYNSSLIRLTIGYRGLSKGGGEIVVGEGYVFFYTFRGILDNFSGFLYGSAIPNKDLGCDVIDEISLAENWKWIACS